MKITNLYNNLNTSITEKECDCCGKIFTFTIPRSQYLYKKVYKDGTYYFCSESCKREYEETRKQLMNRKRAMRRKNKKIDVER